MAKYELLRLSLQNDQELNRQVKLRLPPAAADQQLLRVHCPGYLESLKSGSLDPKIERRIGFPYSPGMLERSRRSVGATLAACRDALSEGVAVNLAGGTHHAFRDRGEGFCVFNDSAVALKTLQAEGLIQRAIVIDTDVHQGNGTAAILAEDPSIFTFSIHGEKNFPFRKEKSDLDIALPDGTGDQDYLAALQEALARMLEIEADMVIFQTGADPYQHDKLGRLSLSREGLAQRDRTVFEWCRQRGLPVAVTMGGGYAPKVAEIVAIHKESIRLALQLHRYSRSLRASPSDSRDHFQAG